VQPFLYHIADNEDFEMRLSVLLAPLMLLAGCADEPSRNGVDTVTPAEAEALNDAAEMLDQTEPPPRLIEEKAKAPAPPEPAR
jgi:hypothetical protein